TWVHAPSLGHMGVGQVRLRPSRYFEKPPGLPSPRRRPKPQPRGRNSYMNSNGRRRKTLALALALAGSTVVALTALTTGPAVAAPPAAGPGGVTMVNGAGKTVTLPATAAAALKAKAGQSSHPGTGPVAKTKDEPVGIDSVIGPDGRVQESIPSTYPWGAIAH